MVMWCDTLIKHMFQLAFTHMRGPADWLYYFLTFWPTQTHKATMSLSYTHTHTTIVLLTSSCQFSLNHTIWSTMPSREESNVGCNSRCMCMILLQRHIGAVALIGPGSEAPEWDWAPIELGCCCPDASGERGYWRGEGRMSGHWY